MKIIGAILLSLLLGIGFFGLQKSNLAERRAKDIDLLTAKINDVSNDLSQTTFKEIKLESQISMDKLNQAVAKKFYQIQVDGWKNLYQEQLANSHASASATTPKTSDRTEYITQIASVLNQVIEVATVANKQSAQFKGVFGAQKRINDQEAASLAAINCSRCPQDFQSAWQKFINAYIEVETHVTVPMSLLSVVDAMHGSTSRSESIAEYGENLQASVLELKQVCAQYGIDSSHAVQ